MAKSTPETRIVFLDYLRIFAFLSVVLGHEFLIPIQSYIGNEDRSKVLRAVVEYLSYLIVGGGVGVVVFFLVSGYIITHVLFSETTIRFLIKRAFRIYPLYWFAVITELVVTGESVDLAKTIPQLLLVGDFLNTTYSLQGVEWTLRIEALFYLFMAALKGLNFLDNRIKYLPYSYFVATLFLFLIAPFPTSSLLSVGYVSIFMPFLFLGSLFYLKERRLVDNTLLVLFFALVFGQYNYLLNKFQPGWISALFGELGTLIFLIAWAIREKLLVTPPVIFLSDLTYAVYLFHKWAWEPIKNTFSLFFVSFLNQDIQVFVLVLLLSYLLHHTVERLGIKIGKKVLYRIGV